MIAYMKGLISLNRWPSITKWYTVHKLKEFEKEPENAGLFHHLSPLLQGRGEGGGLLIQKREHQAAME